MRDVPFTTYVMRALFFALCSLWVLGCSSLSSVRTISSTSDGTVQLEVAQKGSANYAHPATINVRSVEQALFKTGRFLPAQVHSLAPGMSREFEKIARDELFWIQGMEKDVLVWFDGKAIIVSAYDGSREVSRAKYTPREEASTVAASATTPAVVGTASGQGGVTSPVTPAAQTRDTPRMWLFAVGVSAYKDTSISLQYAARDAQAIDTHFASRLGGDIPDTRRVLLTDKEATRANVLSELTELAGRTAPDDLLLVYLAMHGLPEERGELYFLTHETDPRHLVATGLPQRDLEYALERAPAKHTVLLVDACHAGGVGLGNFANRRGIVMAETNRLIVQLAKTKPGRALLTASTATESSQEGERWGDGHGVFTYHLIEGLKLGDTDGDGLVSIRELYDYVYEHVSGDTKGGQHPELKGNFDNALPLSRTTQR
jgi:uncharacterized caspase-like protein